MAYSLTTRMSKRTNYSGEPKGKRTKAAYRAKPKMNYEQLQKNSGEKKGVDLPLGVAVISTTNTNGAAFTLNLVEPGSGSYNRVGRKIFCKSIRLTGFGQYTAAPVTTTFDLLGNTMRMVVVWDKQPSGTLPTFDDVFGVTLQDGTEQSQFLAPPRYDNMSRFQVLRDKVIDCNPQLLNPSGGSTNLNRMAFHFDEYIKLGNRTTVYSGQSSPCTIADISSGALYVYFRSAADTSGDSEFDISTASNARLRYSD